MNATISASSLRGTVTSSRIVVGRRRASAEKALRRADASASASASSRASAHLAGAVLARDRRHPLALVRDRRGMAVGLHQQHGVAVGGQADVRVVLDAARRHRSRNSSVHGMIRAAMIADTVSAASSIRS